MKMIHDIRHTNYWGNFLILLMMVATFPSIAQEGGNDNSFSPQPGINGWGGSAVETIALQTDGKIIIAGEFDAYNLTSRPRIARLHTDAALDTSFNPGTGANGTIQSCLVQHDGKILIAGDFTHYNGHPAPRLARLLPGGAIDTTFNPGLGADGKIWMMVLQKDQKILLVGQFNKLNGVDVNTIARLNPNGSLDTTFNAGAGANGASRSSYAVALQQDGRIYVGGSFTQFGGKPANCIARLYPDGRLDSTFKSNPGISEPTGSIVVLSVFAIAPLPEGKVLIGGCFSKLDGVNRKGLARVDSTGGLDVSFDPGSGLGGTNDPYTHRILVQRDGRILLAGRFGTYNNASRSRVVRINENGALDASFNPGTGAGNADCNSRAIALQCDGNLIVGGNFTTYNQSPRNGIVRVLNADTVALQVQANASASAICAGDSLTLTGSGMADYFEWDQGVLDGVAFVPSASATYRLRGQFGVCYADTLLSVDVHALPEVGINTSKDTVCKGESLVLTGTGAMLYTWEPSIENGIAFAPDSTATYTVTGTDSNACSRHASIRVPVVKVNTEVINVDSGLKAVNEQATYQWIDCGNQNQYVMGATSQIFSPEVSGSYAVELKESGCIDRSECFYATALPAEPADKEALAFSLVPNPARNICLVRSEKAMMGSEIIVITISGQVVKMQKVQNAKSFELDIADLPEGFYFVEVTSGYQRSVQKLLIQ